MGLLDGLLGGSNQQSSMSPLTALLLGVLAYRTYQGKGRLADILGRSGVSPGAAPANPLGQNTGQAPAASAIYSKAVLEDCLPAVRPAACWAAA